MKHLTPIIAAAALALTLTGCATMSASECATANWQDLGHKDGQHGYPLSHMDERRQDCAKNGVSLNSDQYQAGYKAGILEYCTPSNGQTVGLQGQVYLNSCPANLEPEFLSHYEAGKRVYRAKLHINELNQESTHKQHQLKKAQDDSTRQELRHDLRQLDHQLDRAREELRKLENNLP